MGADRRTDRSWRSRLTQPDTLAPEGFRPLVTPVYRGATTVFDDAASARDTWDQDDLAYTYGQYGTPTAQELAARVCELEHGYRTFIVPGGQSALALVNLAVPEAGDHVLLPESIYGPTRSLADVLLQRLGLEVSYYPPLAGREIAQLFRLNTRLVWCESPGSNTMEVQDVPAIVDASHARGAVVALDNTWSAGVYFDAFAHGVDISIQALTKYIGGHADLLLGSVTLRDAAHYRRVGETLSLLGMVVSPDDCSLALRGLQTLAVRLDAIERAALQIAQWLATRAEIALVLHPALPSCPGHEAWRRDFTGSSGVFSVVFADRFSQADVFRFVDGLRLFPIGYSWGGVTSLVMPWPDPPNRPDAPYGDRLVRLSIGLEDPADLRADLEAALGELAMA
jgi:cysteine-S-conjugate beta-lyase